MWRLTFRDWTNEQTISGTLSMLNQKFHTSVIRKQHVYEILWSSEWNPGPGPGSNLAASITKSFYQLGDLAHPGHLRFFAWQLNIHLYPLLTHVQASVQLPAPSHARAGSPSQAKLHLGEMTWWFTMWWLSFHSHCQSTVQLMVLNRLVLELLSTWALGVGRKVSCSKKNRGWFINHSIKKNF